MACPKTTMAPRPDPTRAFVECVPDAHTALLRGDDMHEGSVYILPIGLDASRPLAWLTVRAALRDFGLADVRMGSYPVTAAQLMGSWVMREEGTNYGS